MEWIYIKDKLPNPGDYCWVCDKEKNVFDACYETKCPNFDNYPNKELILKYFKGFCIDQETGSYINNDEILAWMVYFTPKPPKD